MDCAPSPTGALYRAGATLEDSGFPTGENSDGADAGAQALRAVHRGAKQELSETWLAFQHTPPAALQQAQPKFAAAFDLLRDLMMRQAKALPKLRQWQLVNEQERLCQVATHLTEPFVVGDEYWSTLQAADDLVTVLIQLMESLIPPWLPIQSEGGPPVMLPRPARDVNSLVRPEDKDAIVEHFVAEYDAVLAVASAFTSAIATARGGADTETPNLATLVERLNAEKGRMRAEEGGHASTVQFQRMQLLWHVERDLTYQRGLPGGSINTTFDNAGAGNCGYLSFVASVGLDGITADAQLGYPKPQSAAESAYKNVRTRAAKWLEVGTSDGDLTDSQYSTVIRMRNMELVGSRGNGTNASRQTAWKSNVAKRKGNLHWALSSDWTAIAAVFKRRIHIYDIKNLLKEADEPFRIHYFKHRHAYGDVDHRPVCIASCYVDNAQRGVDDASSVGPESEQTNHYAVILTCDGNCVPWAGGHKEDALPYTDDDANPFELLEERPRPAVPKVCVEPNQAVMDRFQRGFELREAQLRLKLAQARRDLFSAPAEKERQRLRAPKTAQPSNPEEAARYQKEVDEVQEVVDALEAKEAARESPPAAGGPPAADPPGADPPAADPPGADPPGAGADPPGASDPATSKDEFMAAIVEQFKAHAKQQLKEVRAKLEGNPKEVTVGSAEEDRTTMVEGHVQKEWREWAQEHGLTTDEGEAMRKRFATWLQTEFDDLKNDFLNRMKYGQLGWPGSKARKAVKGAKMLYGTNRLLVWGGNALNVASVEDPQIDEPVEGEGQAKAIAFHHNWEVGIIVSPLKGLPPVVGAADALDAQLKALANPGPGEASSGPMQTGPLADPPADPPADRPRPAVDSSRWELPKHVDEQRWLDEYNQRMELWERRFGPNQSPSDRATHSEQLLKDLWEEREAERRKEEGEARKRSDADRRSRGDGEGDRSEGVRIAESEGSDDEEAARYNYTEALLTDTQIAFVRNMLKTAHEAFVVHHSNRHNYGKIALMDGSGDAVVSGSNAKTARARTTSMDKELKEKTRKLEDWDDADGLNKPILEAWTEHTDGAGDNPWYAKAEAGKSRGGGRDVYNQSMQIVRQLLLDVFNSYKNAVAWWISFKGALEWPAGKAQNSPQEEGYVAYKLREALVNWIRESTEVTYEQDDKLIKCAQFLWDFMEQARKHLEAKKVDYEQEKTIYGDFIDLAQSEQRLNRLTAVQETVSETRQALRSEIAKSEALVEMASPEARGRAKELDDLKAELERAKRQYRAASNPEAERTRRVALEASWRAMFEAFVSTRDRLVSRWAAAAVHARALLREMRDIGYDDDDTPEYETLLNALDEGELILQGSVKDPLENGEREMIWSLISAYREAYSAVYGDGADVVAFRASFEKEADEREREHAGAEPAVPQVAGTDKERAYRQALAELTHLQQQKRALEATALSAEARSLKTRLEQLEARATLDYDSAMAHMVNRLRGLLQNGSAANSPRVQQALGELEAHVARAPQK